ncbi:MAG TPA: cation diffusion facilitator family transporter [Thermoanaerobaculia bacterium]|jgi:cobalt-zinc-cadmium efflux system protein|nr:cation diffusion facilitator family transporter [Thermoanaerobaculia bacterium]
MAQPLSPAGHAHHHHGHGHSHAPASFGRAFALGVGLNLAFVVLEATWGVISHSLALLADAGHNLSDVLGLGLAWGATVLARRVPTERRTYGLRRSTTLAALFNAVLLLAAVGAIAWEAIGRLGNPPPVEGGTLVWVAAVGIAVNTATALLFVAGRKSDLNVRGAFLHMAADAAVSLGVLLAGAVILATGWRWLDPAVSLLISVVILVGTSGLLRDSFNLALDAVPPGIRIADVRRFLEGLPQVCEVHDLHVWGMSTTETAMTAHLVIPNHQPDDCFFRDAAREMHDRFGIEHVTLQVENGDPDAPCRQAPDHVV